MYIIFHKDGSIHESQLNDYVNQNSDGVNFIDVAIVGVGQDKYTISGEYTLPNGEKLSYSASANNKIETSQDTYTGWTLSLYQALTEFSGTLALSIMAVQDGATLFTYPVEINVNKTAGGGKVAIAHDEYKTLLSTIKDYQLQFSASNVRGYSTIDEANADISKLADGQLVIVGDDSDTPEVYKVSGGALKQVPLSSEALKSYFVHKSASSEGDSQAVLTGLSSYYTGTDGVEVNYGQNPSEFFVSVTDKDTGKSAGAIDLEAKEYKFAYDDAVDVFSSDGNTTKIVSPMGNASVELTNADNAIYGNSITLGSKGTSGGNSIKVGVVEFNKNGHDVTFPSMQVSFKGATDLYGYTKVSKATFDVSPTSLGTSLLADGARSQVLDPTLKNGLYADQNAVTLKGVAMAEADPTEDLGIATKGYVDTAVATGGKVKLNIENGAGEGSLQTRGQDCQVTGAGSLAFGSGVVNSYDYSLAIGKNYTPSHSGFLFGVASNGTEVLSMSAGDGFYVGTNSTVYGSATIRRGATIYGYVNIYQGSASVQGDLSVGGTLTATKFVDVQAKTVSTSEYTIGLAKGNESKITTYIGLYATKYNGSDDGALVWDNTGTAYVGDAVVSSDGKITDPNNTLQPLMTRAESGDFADGAFIAWEADKLRAVPSPYVATLANGVKIASGSNSVSVTSDKVSLVGAEADTPTSDNQVANKKYVDDNRGSAVVLRVW